MNNLERLLSETPIPKLIEVEQSIPEGKISREMIPDIVKQQLKNRLPLMERGKSAALTCGSRQINHLDLILKTVIELLKECGVEPFIFPAMGSHGGATAQGQREIIEGLGITEESMQVPIRATMDTVVVGRTASEIEVHLDRYANEADYIIPIGRIKPHTDFRGPAESGLQKMLTIGCGKQQGANICHSLGFPNMSQNIMDISGVLLEKKNIPWGIAIIEDAFHGTYQIECVDGSEIKSREPQLLDLAKGLVPGLPFRKIDVLVLDEIGKDISGAGMDSNITGRSSMLGRWQPFAERIAVLDLTEQSHHNACGIGGADITTQRLFEKMDFETSYPNAVTSHDPASMRIPPVLSCDRAAIQMALHTCMEQDDKLGYRMIWMKNTLMLNRYYISENLLYEANEIPSIKVLGSPFEIEFDQEGNVPWLTKPKRRYQDHEAIGFVCVPKHADRSSNGIQKV